MKWVLIGNGWNLGIQKGTGKTKVRGWVILNPLFGLNVLVILDFSSGGGIPAAALL
jgi:hypothetical protein